jgi:hypothetical protein
MEGQWKAFAEHICWSLVVGITESLCLSHFRPGKVKGIMCSYNAVNGVPMCANSKLLNETLRNTWGFDGYPLHQNNVGANAVRILYNIAAIPLWMLALKNIGRSRYVTSDW